MAYHVRLYRNKTAPNNVKTKTSENVFNVFDVILCGAVASSSAATRCGHGHLQ